MIFEDLFLVLNFYLSIHIYTRPYSFLPVQMMGGRVSTLSYVVWWLVLMLWSCDSVAPSVHGLPGACWSQPGGEVCRGSSRGTHLRHHNTLTHPGHTRLPFPGVYHDVIIQNTVHAYTYSTHTSTLYRCVSSHHYSLHATHLLTHAGHTSTLHTV